MTENQHYLKPLIDNLNDVAYNWVHATGYWIKKTGIEFMYVLKAGIQLAIVKLIKNIISQYFNSN